MTRLASGNFVVTVSTGSGETRRRDAYDLGTADHGLAETRRKKLIAQIKAGKDVRSAVAAFEPVPTVQQHLETWITKRKAQGIVSSRDDEQLIRKYALPIFGNALLTEVRPPKVAEALDAAVAAGAAKETVKHLKAAIGRLFKAAWRAEIITESPIAKVELPPMRETKKQRVILTDDEFLQLLADLDRRCASLDAKEIVRGAPDRRDGSRELRMLCACARVLGGLRTSDTSRWDYTQIDTNRFRLVTVPREKTNAPQELEVPAMLRGALRDWWERAGKPSSGPVFPSTRGRTRGGFKASRGTSYAARLRKACVAAGLTRPELYRPTSRTLPVDFHSFRRAFASALANAPGVTMQHSMKLTDHADPRTHLRYVLSPTEIPAAALPQPSDHDQEIAPEHRSIVSHSARHSGFEPLAFGSGGRRDDHTGTRWGAKDARVERGDAHGDHPGPRGVAADCLSLPSVTVGQDTADLAALAGLTHTMCALVLASDTFDAAERTMLAAGASGGRS